MPVFQEASPVPHDVPNRIGLHSAGQAHARVSSASDSPPWRHEHFLRFAAELKALGRPFPRALELGSGPGELADTVLHEVPGLRLVSLDSSNTMHGQAQARLANKEGRMTSVTRNIFDIGWADGLGRFDAVIAGPAIHAPHRPVCAATLYAQVRPLLLPGGIFLLCDHVTTDVRVRFPASCMSPDEHHEALDEAGWSSTQTLRHDQGVLLLKARP